MICIQLAECLNKLEYKNKYTSCAKPVKGKRSSSHRKTRIMPTLVGNPCQDEERLRKCVSFFDNRSKPSCTENQMTYRIVNENKLQVIGIHLDKGVVDSNDTQKCDYLFLFKDNPERIVLIELKGKHVNEAIRQLKDTIELPTIQSLIKPNSEVYGRIIASGSVPKIRSLEEQRLIRFLKIHRGNLVTRERSFEEPYSEMQTV